jgi:hypothetical protein
VRVDDGAVAWHRELAGLEPDQLAVQEHLAEAASDPPVERVSVVDEDLQHVAFGRRVPVRLPGDVLLDVPNITAPMTSSAGGAGARRDGGPR